MDAQRASTSTVSPFPYHSDPSNFPHSQDLSAANSYYGRTRFHNHSVNEHGLLHAAVHPSPYPLPAFAQQVPRREEAHHTQQSSSDAIFAPNAHQLYCHATSVAAAAAAAAAAGATAASPDGAGGLGGNHYAPSTSIPRLPPILQVEKQQVTTSATQAASASRRRNEAHFQCPVPGCGSTFTRRFNLRGHLRSHTEERPYICEWPGCNKGFARQHDCKRHQALHSTKSHSNVCSGCGKTFSRLDALNRHLRSEGGAECRQSQAQINGNQTVGASGNATSPSVRSDENEEWDAERARSASTSNTSVDGASAGVESHSTPTPSDPPPT